MPIFELDYKKHKVKTTIHFEAPDLETAIPQAQEYCKRIGAYHIHTSPFTVDLAKEVDRQERIRRIQFGESEEPGADVTAKDPTVATPEKKVVK